MSKKTEKKKQEKIIEDKTFGLKNKNKSKVVQSFCKGVQVQVKKGGVSQQLLEAQIYEEKKMKKKQLEEEALIQSLFRTVDQVKNQEEEEQEEEQDPKKILCPYFKQGICQKGKKCKNSHDMSLEQKADILDIYTDQREQMPGYEDDIENCLNWDDKTLKDVVEANAAKYTSQKPTEIVCKFFLDALEKGKYGWKWVCPNGKFVFLLLYEGMTCHYRHCLPQGYVLKKGKKDEKVRDERLLEDIIDEQREKAATSGVKITKEIFLKWKEERAKKKEEEKKQEYQNQQEKKKNSKGPNYNLSGRALFQYDPSVFVDDEEAADEQVYENRSEHHTDSEEEQPEQQQFTQIEEQQVEEEEQEDQNQFAEKTQPQEEQKVVETQVVQVKAETQELEQKQTEQEEKAEEDAEQKKKKKKKNKNKKKNQNDQEVKINDDVFQDDN